MLALITTSRYGYLTTVLIIVLNHNHLPLVIQPLQALNDAFIGSSMVSNPSLFLTIVGDFSRTVIPRNFPKIGNRNFIKVASALLPFWLTQEIDEWRLNTIGQETVWLQNNGRMVKARLFHGVEQVLAFTRIAIKYVQHVSPLLSIVSKLLLLGWSKSLLHAHKMLDACWLDRLFCKAG